MSLSLFPAPVGDLHKTKDTGTRPFVAISVSSLISQLEQHSRSCNNPTSKTISSVRFSYDVDTPEMLNTRRPPQQISGSTSLQGMELYVRSNETLDNVHRGHQARKSTSVSSIQASPRVKSRSSRHSAFQPKRLSDWEPPVEWLHDSNTPDSMSETAESSVKENQRPKTAPRDSNTRNSNLLAYRTVGSSAEPLLPDISPAVTPNDETITLSGKQTPFRVTALPTPPESPTTKQSELRPLLQLNPIDASGPSRTNFYSKSWRMNPQRIDTSLEHIGSLRSRPSVSKPIPRVRRGPRRDVSSAYSTKDEDYANKIGVIEVGAWEDEEATSDFEDPLSSDAYRSLVDDYRRLAQPRMSMFEENENESDEEEPVAQEVKLAPQPLFWSENSTKRPKSNISYISGVSDNLQRVQRRPSTQRSVRSKRTSAVFIGKSKHTSSVTTLMAKRNLFISVPIPVNEAAYLAAIQDHEALNGPSISGGAMTFVTDLERPKRPWHHRLSPRKLAFSLENVRHSVQKITSPIRRFSAERKRSKSTTPEEEPSSDADSWLSAVEYDEPEDNKAQSKNIMLLFNKLKWKSQAKEWRKRNEELRNNIKHIIGSEQGVGLGTYGYSSEKKKKWL
jgi:hypothetical protein